MNTDGILKCILVALVFFVAGMAVAIVVVLGLTLFR